MSNERLSHLTDKLKPTEALQPAGQRFSDAELSEIKRAIGKRLKEAFDTDNYSEIAERLKTTATVTRFYVLGERFPAPEFLIQFRRVTGISTDWLLTGEGPKYVKFNSAFNEDEENQIKELARANGRTFLEQTAKLATAGLKFLEKLHSWKE